MDEKSQFYIFLILFLQKGASGNVLCDKHLGFVLITIRLDDSVHCPALKSGWGHCIISQMYILVEHELLMLPAGHITSL